MFSSVLSNCFLSVSSFVCGSIGAKELINGQSVGFTGGLGANYLPSSHFPTRRVLIYYYYTCHPLKNEK
jgi:hypothetical protein